MRLRSDTPEARSSRAFRLGCGVCVFLFPIISQKVDLLSTDMIDSSKTLMLEESARCCGWQFMVGDRAGEEDPEGEPTCDCAFLFQISEKRTKYTKRVSVATRQEHEDSLILAFFPLCCTSVSYVCLAFAMPMKITQLTTVKFGLRADK